MSPMTSNKVSTGHRMASNAECIEAPKIHTKLKRAIWFRYQNWRTPPRTSAFFQTITPKSNTVSTSCSTTSHKTIDKGRSSVRTTTPGGVWILCTTPCTCPGHSENTSGNPRRQQLRNLLQLPSRKGFIFFSLHSSLFLWRALALPHNGCVAPVCSRPLIN